MNENPSYLKWHCGILYVLRQDWQILFEFSNMLSYQGSSLSNFHCTFVNIWARSEDITITHYFQIKNPHIFLQLHSLSSASNFPNPNQAEKKLVPIDINSRYNAP